MRRSVWRFGIGLAIVVAYGTVVLRLTGPAVRPLFDGGKAPAYHWVNPPPQFTATNQLPDRRTSLLALAADGSEELSLSTRDGQATAAFPKGAFAPRAGESTIQITIEPLDPAAFGPAPPRTRYDGNAYRVAATYRRSGIPAGLHTLISVDLQFPIHATRLLRRDAAGWSELTDAKRSGSNQIFGAVSMLGVFVADGPPLSSVKKTFPAAIVISVGAAAAAVVAGVVTRSRSRRRMPQTERAKG